MPERAPPRSTPHASCSLLATHHSLLLARTHHSPTPDSAGRVGVRPAAELRHVQRHRHELDVLGALRASPAPATHVGPRLHAACTAAPPHALAPPGPHAARTLCPPHDSAGRGGVQRAAELQHVQRHRHGQDVLCALRASPAPRSPSRPSPARCSHRCAAPRPRAFPARMPPASYARLMTRQWAPVFNQPLSFDTSSVTDMYAMFAVRSAQAPAPATHPGPRPHAACTAAPPHALAPLRPACRLHPMPAS